MRESIEHMTQPAIDGLSNRLTEVLCVCRYVDIHSPFSVGRGRQNIVTLSALPARVGKRALFGRPLLATIDPSRGRVNHASCKSAPFGL
ncbi:hypothetical protein Q31b_34190 [Novipirellula aureliae]|uniref:Uncharacterized protein n=1 Tax=Novipirellula aureliae TaxID=2527966 RepID=A0A5C6DUS8_9BACT|nr:hypothetical protein Q31b_34190 [Novipirellula aureliae]